MPVVFFITHRMSRSIRASRSRVATHCARAITHASDGSLSLNLWKLFTAAGHLSCIFDSGARLWQS
jgi:hypothetical protein